MGLYPLVGVADSLTIESSKFINVIIYQLFVRRGNGETVSMGIQPIFVLPNRSNSLFLDIVFNLTRLNLSSHPS